MKESRRNFVASVAAGSLTAGGIIGADRFLSTQSTSGSADTPATTATVTGTIPSTTTETVEASSDSETTTTPTTTETTTATTTATPTTTPTTTTTETTTETTTTTTETTTTTTKAPAEIEISSQATRINEGTDAEAIQVTATATNVGGTSAWTILKCTLYTSVGDGISIGSKTNEDFDPGETWTVQWKYEGGRHGDYELDDYTDYEVTARTA